MKKKQFDEMIKTILDNEIDITMSKEKSVDLVWYNLNTQMKSDLEIAFDGDKCIFRGRYNKTGEIKDYEGLLDEVSGCMYGRDFGNSYWFKVLEGRPSYLDELM